MLLGLRFLCLCVFVAETAGRAQETELRRFEYFRIQMGTRVRIVLYAGSEDLAREPASAAFERIQQVDERLSDYNPESELMSLCRQAGGQPQAAGPDMVAVLERSLHFSRLSGGAFDVTVGPLVRLWREARRSNRLPEAEEVRKAHSLTGYKKLSVDRGKGIVRLARAGMRLDLGGIAKGYAADQALAELRRRGIGSALVDAGGDIGLMGAPPETTGWKISVRSPGGSSGKEVALLLRDCGIATSGDTEQFIEIGGARYSHIVDPRTGVGVRHSASVTVIAPDCASADALATALSVLFPKEGIRLAEAQKGVAAMIVARTSEGLRTYLSRRMRTLLDGARHREHRE